jgi:type IX secretion system PorP/SprF family membrane protein
MKTKHLLIGILFILISGSVSAQQNLVYNHYYLNPFLYNPSYIAPSGYTELYANYRKQWAGIEGAPTTGTLSFHIPLNYKAAVAVSAYQDEAGLLKTTSGMLSFSYQIYLGKKITDIHKIGFGLSAGVTNSRIKSDEADDIQDPVLGNNTSSIDGQFGLHYQYNGFKLSFALPRIFDTKVASEESFNASGISQLNSTISSISYDMKIGSRFSIEPIISYRTYENLEPQYEVLTSFKLANAGWIGGSYRDGYGAAGFLGVNIKEKIKIGYAYEFATEQTDKVGNGSHEVQLVLRLGKKQFTRPQLTKKTPPVTHPETVTATDPEVKTETEVVDEPAPEPVAQNEQPVTQTPKVQPEVVETPPSETKPPAEVKRQVTTLKGEGLMPGHYVVVGAFHNMLNAKTFAATLKKSGYPANVAFHPDKGYYIVHMEDPSATIEEAKVLRDQYRQMSRYSFKDTWILTIE